VCLGVPGKVLTVEENAQGMIMGTVSFAGVNKEICLAYLPEAKPDDYVIVHAGFAISIINEQEAEETFEILRRMGELADLEEAGEGAPGAAANPGPAPPDDRPAGSLPLPGSGRRG
jgi:hydrogenase expression/formation protein HypC